MHSSQIGQGMDHSRFRLTAFTILICICLIGVLALYSRRNAHSRATLPANKHTEKIIPQDNTSQAPPDDPIEVNRRVFEQNSETIQRILREPKDVRWSSLAEHNFERDLGKNSRRFRYSIDEVDCRQTSCIATLTWPSFQAVLASYPSIVSGEFSLNCAAGISFKHPEPSAVNSPFHAQVIFDCHALRATEQRDASFN
jgi:hypothetical protein